MPVLFRLATAGACWARSPTRLALDEDTLHIERRAWRPLGIPLRAIAAVEATPRASSASAAHLVAAARPLRAYATRSGPSVLLRRRGALPVLVTPDDPQAVVAPLCQTGAPRSVAPRDACEVPSKRLEFATRPY